MAVSRSALVFFLVEAAHTRRRPRRQVDSSVYLQSRISPRSCMVAKKTPSRTTRTVVSKDLAPGAGTAGQLAHCASRLDMHSRQPSACSWCLLRRCCLHCGTRFRSLFGSCLICRSCRSRIVETREIVAHGCLGEVSRRAAVTAHLNRSHCLESVEFQCLWCGQTPWLCTSEDQVVDRSMTFVEGSRSSTRA